MREFHAFEYVDGDRKVYAKPKGASDSEWREVGLIKFGARTTVRDAADAAERFGLQDMEDGEVEALAYAIAWPRRW